MVTEQDYLISIENAITALYKAGKAADVEHVLRVFGHGARFAENLCPADYDAVYGELHQHLADLDD